MRLIILIVGYMIQEEQKYAADHRYIAKKTVTIDRGDDYDSAAYAHK